MVIINEEVSFPTAKITWTGIIDRFGEEVETNIVDKEHLSVKTTVSLSGTFFGWIVSFGGKMKLTAPDYAVERFCILINQFI